MSAAEWAVVYALAKATWPASKLTTATAAAWYPHVMRFPAARVRAAVLQLGAECAYAPSVAALVRACTPREKDTGAKCVCGDRRCKCAAAGVCEFGWELTLEDGHEVVRPCKTCRPAAHELWRVGHWCCPDRRACEACRTIVVNGVR